MKPIIKALGYAVLAYGIIIPTNVCYFNIHSSVGWALRGHRFACHWAPYNGVEMERFFFSPPMLGYVNRLSKSRVN